LIKSIGKLLNGTFLCQSVDTAKLFNHKSVPSHLEKKGDSLAFPGIRTYFHFLFDFDGMKKCRNVCSSRKSSGPRLQNGQETGLPDFSWCMIPKTGKMYRMAVKFPKSR
jgi:hypothetical protein